MSDYREMLEKVEQTNQEFLESCIANFFGLALCLLILFWENQNGNWQTKFELWGILAAAFGCFSIFKLKIDPLFRVTLGYLLLTSIAAAALAGYHDADKELIVLLRVAGWQFVVALLTFVTFLRMRIDLTWPLRICAALVSLGIVFSKTPLFTSGFLWNPSMASTFVVLASGVNPLSAIPIFFSHSWTAGFSLFAGLVFFFRGHISTRDLIGLTTIVVAAIFWHLYTHGGIPYNGRLPVWKFYFSWWKNSGWRNVLFGSGAGTGMVWLPVLGFLNPIDGLTHIVPWAHNDWLQALIETGIVGIILLAGCVVKLWTLAGQKDRALMVSYGVAMLSNMPMHWAIHALVGWTLVSRVSSRAGS